jgi:hypothetical protein
MDAGIWTGKRYDILLCEEVLFKCMQEEKKAELTWKRKFIYFRGCDGTERSIACAPLCVSHIYKFPHRVP